MAKQKGQNTGAKARTTVPFPPLFLIIRAREMVEKLLLIEIRSLANQVGAAVQQRDTRHLRNKCTNSTAEAADCQIFISHHVRKLQAVSLKERAFQQWPGYFEADKVVKPV